MQLKTQIGHRLYLEKIGGNLRNRLENGLEFIGWDKHINKNSTAFIKPNFTFPSYKPGVTTTPEVLRAILEVLKNRAGRIIVGESDGGNNSFKADEAFQGHNMYQICQESSAELINLSKLPSTIVKEEICGKTVEVELPRLLLEEIDCFISVPVLKVHVMTTVTLSLKNSWGCVPDTMRCLQHQDIDYKLTLIAKHLKPSIIIVDGTYALDRHGPMYGNALKTDLLLVSDNTVAADAMGARLMGFDPRRIKHIAIAEKTGLGSTGLDDLTVNAEWQRHVKHFTVKRTLVDSASRLLFCSDALARLVMQSPLTPLIYQIARLLRSKEEKDVANQLVKKKDIGLY
jgi:uncharacterized protein (DUF362 family)